MQCVRDQYFANFCVNRWNHIGMRAISSLVEPSSPLQSKAVLWCCVWFLVWCCVWLQVWFQVWCGWCGVCCLHTLPWAGMMMMRDERCQMFTVYLCSLETLRNLCYEDEGWELLIRQNQHCGACSWETSSQIVPVLSMNCIVHSVASVQVFWRLFKAVDGTPSVRPEPFHGFCHPWQSDRGLGKKWQLFTEILQNLSLRGIFYPSPEMSTRAFDRRTKLIRQLHKSWPISLTSQGN